MPRLWCHPTSDPGNPPGQRRRSLGSVCTEQQPGHQPQSHCHGCSSSRDIPETAWTRGTFQLQLEFGAVVGMLGRAVQERLSIWGNLHLGSWHSTLQKDFPKCWHCSNSVSLLLQLGLLSTTQGNAGAGTRCPLEGGKWKAPFRKELSCCCECDMAEGLSVQLSRELGDSRLGEPLRHPRNEARRKQRKCQRAGKDSSSGNISWPAAAEWLEQKESRPLNRTRTDRTYFCSLRISMSQNW